MTGILLVNHFLSDSRFRPVQELFLAAAKERGISLSLKTGGEFSSPLGEPLSPSADFILFWDKDVPLARRLEREGLPLFNSSEAIRISDSKIETALALSDARLSMPRTVIAPMTFDGVGYIKDDFVRSACRSLGLPVVIKEAYGSFGEQVYLAKTEEQAVDTVRSIGARPFLFQEYVAASYGTDVRMNVVGGSVVAAMRRRGPAGDFRSNLGIGGVGEPYAPSDEACALAVAAARAVGADFAGVDLLFDEDGRPLVCEVNSNPQFAGTHRVCGVNLAEHILDYIQRKMS